MARGAKSEELRKQKESKQKKLLLFVLLPALAIAVGIQAPKLKDLFTSAKEKTASVQGQVVQGYEELAPTIPVETPGAPSDLTISATAGLSDTDTPPETDEGQLISFTRFDAQDPFVQLVEAESEGDQQGLPGEGEGETVSGTGTGTSPVTETTTTTSTSAGDATATFPDDSTGSVAVSQVSISVNGSAVVVAVGETFPENDPAFKLVAIEGNIVTIGLASGSFSDGVETIDLRVGDSVTLISQPDGARFQLKLLRVG
jgi:hypothetical protein